MIELLYCNRTEKSIACLTNLLSWLAATIEENERYKDIDLSGFMILKNSKDGVAGLIICGDNTSQTKILEVLQQPPGEFKGKYIARVPAEEPVCVEEKAEDKPA